MASEELLCYCFFVVVFLSLTLSLIDQLGYYSKKLPFEFHERKKVI